MSSLVLGAYRAVSTAAVALVLLGPLGASAQQGGRADAPDSLLDRRLMRPTAASAEPVHDAGRAERSVEARRALGRIVVDGVPDEDAWRLAPVVGGFVQSEPSEGAPASEATEVRVVYDDRFLYVGVMLYDREPGRAVVNDIRKDFKEEDQDTFELILDTFGDRRNGYVFSTNVEGARADKQVSNEGREVNASWDAPWSVRTRRLPNGWSAEFAIPLRALRFDPRGDRPWGINFSRRIRRNNEVDFWAPVPRAFALTRLSLAGELTGVHVEGGGRDVRLKPYVLASSVRGMGQPAESRQSAVGADAKFGVTPGLTVDVTIHPDFAQAEADEQQVNLTQFSQFLPEKRDFFLENSGIFYVGDAARNNRVNPTPTPDEDLLLFFSRRIGLSPSGQAIPLAGGVRLTGRTGPLGIGALAIATQRTATSPSNRYGVLRMRRDLFAGSDVGMILMTRQSENSADFNRVYGVDGTLRFFRQLDWSSYLVRTQSPGIDAGQYAARTSLNWEGNFFHGKGALMSIGDGFNDDLGYFRRRGVKKWVADVGVRPRLASLRQVGIREMHPHVSWDYFTDQRNQPVAKRLHSGYTFFLNDGGYWELSMNPVFQRLDTPFRIDQGIAPIPAGGYEWVEWTVKGGTDPSRPLSLTFQGTTGGFWDGTQRTVQSTATVRPSYRLRLSAGVQRTDAHLRTPEAAFTATLWTARSSYAFSTNAFADALVQYDPRSRQLNSNVRFNVIHHPLSDLFVVYNDQRVLTPEGPIPGRSLAVKVTQMLGF